jgi:hypothetical protein
MQGCSEKNVDSLVHRRVRSDSRGGATFQARYLFPSASGRKGRAGVARGAPEGRRIRPLMNAEVLEREGEAVVAAVRLAPVHSQGRMEVVVGRRTRVAQ